MSVIRKVVLNSGKFNKFFAPAIRKLSDDSHPNIVRSPAFDVVVPEMTIPEFFYEKTTPFSRYVAIECSSSGKKYKFGEIRNKTRNFSKSLRKIFKLDNNDVVAVLLPNTPDYLIATLGIMESRMTVTSMNPSYTAHEISKQLLDASAKVIITNAAMLDTVKNSLQLIKKQLPIITIKTKNDEPLPAGTISFEELINTTYDMPDIEPGYAQDTAFLPYSSGTTGLPKGVELSHRNIIANLLQGTHPDFVFIEETSGSFQNVTPAVLPIFHIYGFSITLLNSLIQGTKAITLEKFTPDSYLSVLKNNPITLIYAAPPLVLYLTAYDDVKPEYLKNLRMITCGAAPLGSSDEERILEKFGSNICIAQGYGMTETSPLVSFSPKSLQGSPESRGSVGIPISNTLIKIIDPENPTGPPLGPNQKGELLVKGPQVMKQYHNKPEETAKTILDGWLRSGDIATYNEKGLFYIADRLKELIKVKGFQVPPAELEELIRTYPSIQDAAVIGIPHPIDGEVPRAYITVKGKEQIDLDQLQNFVADKVAKYKRLKGGIQIVESIPKNSAGKILRRQLKQKYEAEGI